MLDEELTTYGVAVGGDALARDGAGRVVFVAGALPGERVRVRLVESRRDFARASVVEVVEPSPDRVAPPCEAVGRGCGGCPWQGVDVIAQRRLKRDMVLDALRRVGRVAEPPVAAEVQAVPASAYRTTVRVAVDGEGRAAYRKHHSHSLVTVGSCLVAHPLVDEVLAVGRFPGASEVVVRASAATGERLVVPRPAEAAVEVPGPVYVGERAFLTETVAGRRWRVSGGSFFQSGPAAAELLVDAVRRAAGAVSGTVVDAYAGVGLLGGSLGGDRLVAVESSGYAVRDARRNLPGAEVVRNDVERWVPVAADLVVADPARAGLGRRAVKVLAATAAPVLVLVACDAGSLGRDVGLLRDAGYALASVEVLDLFPHTVHVEAVARFERVR